MCFVLAIFVGGGGVCKQRLRKCEEGGGFLFLFEGWFLVLEWFWWVSCFIRLGADLVEVGPYREDCCFIVV